MAAKWMRNALSALCLSVLTLGLLTGCGIKLLPQDGYDGPMSIKREGSTLAIVVCQDLLVHSILAQARNIDAGEDWLTFLDATGDFNVEASEILNLGDLPDSVRTSELTSPTLRDGSQIAVFITAEDAELNVLFSIGDGGLSATEWLHPDGAITKDPCSG